MAALQGKDARACYALRENVPERIINPRPALKGLFAVPEVLAQMYGKTLRC